MMGFRDAERFIHLWCLFERGFAEGMEAAIRQAEESVRCEDTNDQQRDVLLRLCDSLRKARRTRIFGDS
ncbi:hypothetical protein MSTO_38740 [Mycobacterium stomatepiae]|uniref:Uncharacterized protein n=1 Tax=Mycobacterium stomatepiae TaxID=470076 RepID=A0A7I7QBL6_9MYCO|nr:hypothetical protein MSTO_38740 [Mycobacterium stomatepiae]